MIACVEVRVGRKGGEGDWGEKQLGGVDTIPTGGGGGGGLHRRSPIGRGQKFPDFCRRH